MPGGKNRTVTTIAMTGLAGIFVITLLATISFGLAGIWFVDVARSYTAGANYYSRYQKSAVLALLRYGDSRDEADFAAYRRAIAVPLADRAGRLTLDDPQQPVRASYPNLIAGLNHPGDVPGMAWIFHVFRDTAFLRPSVQSWSEADGLLLEIEQVAADMREAIRQGPWNRERNAVFTARLLGLDARMTEVQDRFAEQVNALGRSVRHWFVLGLVGLGGLLVLMALVYGKRLQRRLAGLEAEGLEREARFRDIADMSADWVWETDSEDRFVYCSERLLTVTGLPLSSFIGRPRGEMCGVGAENAQFREDYMAAIQHRRSYRDLEYIFKVPDPGSDRERGIRLRISGVPVFDRKGRFRGYRGTGRDVTREVAIRREIDEQRELLETVLLNLPQGLAVFDAEARLRFCNDPFQQMMELPEALCRVGTGAQDILRYLTERGEYGPQQDVEVKVRERLDWFRAGTAPYQHQRPKGTILMVRSIRLPSGGFIVSFLDVTQQRALETGLVRAKEEAELANTAKSDFLANMSHELRTPLNAIIGFSQMMEQAMFGELSGRYRSYAGDIRLSGEHLLSIIQDILDLARVESGKLAFEQDYIDLHRIAEECCTMLRPTADRAEVRLVNAIPTEAPVLLADERRIRQILINLVGNAIKFSPRGKDVTVGLEDIADGLALTVADQGIGMTKEETELAFEPFVQLKMGMVRKHEGAGLGLALVRRFAEAFGATAMIDSAPGVGTTVRIRFPRDRVEPDGGGASRLAP
ncbi:PAS-domain containing protein [Oceanibaculum nanhaiense]|uniref:PAS-domain containing protein n=1 Tax=Oceanibaculum nanhaiense TaxID=1909734 RepID=UPI003F729683